MAQKPEKHATRVPTVLIGIGGIGGQIVRLVDNELKNCDKKFVRMLVLDTNTNDLSKLDKTNIPYVQTSENMTVSDYLRRNKRFEDWFPYNPLLNGKNLIEGAGQVRSVSRLGALASEAAGRFEKIKDAITEVSRNVGSTIHKTVRVMIVGSVCGGTGSGMGIQLPFLVRDMIDEISNMPNAIVRGLFIMPDIVEEVQDTDQKRRSVYVNGFAFLRELNAFNKAQTFQRGTERLRIEHYRRADTDPSKDHTVMSRPAPYDFLFLIEKSNVHGQNIGNFDAYISKAAQIVVMQLFASDMTASMHSSEDNLIVSAVERNGMNRYCGAGVSKAVYPEEENIRYCTLRFTESILKGHWLKIDRMVDLNMAQHKRLMATNPSLMPKDPHVEYMTVFDTLTDPTKSEVTAEMGQLKREIVSEAIIVDSRGVEHSETLNRAVNLFTSIEGFTEDLFKSPDLQDEANKCKMSTKRLTSDNAVAYATAQLQTLRRYEKMAKERVGMVAAGAVDSIMGADRVVADTYMDSVQYPYNICAAIRDKHPIVARYMLYYVRKMLSERLASFETEISDLKDQETIFTKDYYREKSKNGEKDTDHEDPPTALSITSPGWLSGIGVNSAAYNKLVRTIVKDSNAFVEHVNKLNGLLLKTEIYNTVIKRVDILIGIYEDFFHDLEKILLYRRKEREILEEEQPRIQFSDVYVCSDTVCKRWMYDKFESSITGFDSTLPDSVKQTFFDTVFGEYENKHKEIVDKTSFTRKPLSTEQMFESAIIKPLTDKFMEKELLHVRMDIISAIKLEYSIHSQQDCLTVNGSKVDPSAYDFEQYFASVMRQVKELSTPYFSYHTVSENVHKLLTPNADASDIADDEEDEDTVTTLPSAGRLLCYWGVNNRIVAQHQHKEDSDVIDRDALNSMFGMRDGETYYVVNDDSFDPAKLICYSSIYDFVIENLDKYAKKSKAYREYNKRMLRVIKSDYNVGAGNTAYLDTVHPHLDRRWHAHAYLPLLMIDDEVEEQKRIARAFLLGTACRRMWYIEIDREMCWAFRKKDQRLPNRMILEEKPVTRPSFYQLFLAVDENTVVVNDIHNQARHDVTDAYNKIRVGGITTADLLKQPIVEGFIGDSYTAADIKDLGKVYYGIYNDTKKPVNILEVIYSVYTDSYDLKLVSTLVDNLSGYLNEYCLKMTNDQPGAAAELFDAAAKAIGANFVSFPDASIEFKMLIEAYL